MIKKKPQKSREEINEQSRLLKRKKKHKGLPSGSRLNNAESAMDNKATNVAIDARIGSKKPVPLTVESVKINRTPTLSTTQVKINKLSPEQELTRLENDPYLERLLDQSENGESLTVKQQQDLNKMLDRIDSLMQQLGYTDLLEDADDEHETKEDIVSLLKRH